MDALRIEANQGMFILDGCPEAQLPSGSGGPVLAGPEAISIAGRVEDYAWEVELKGVFWDARIVLGGLELPITFYDPARLAQDVDEDVKSQHSFAVNNLIVVRRVTNEEMTNAVTALPPGFFGGNARGPRRSRASTCTDSAGTESTCG